MQKTIEQLKTIHAICGKLKISNDMRAEMIIEVTDGRSSSSKDLNYQEAKELIRHLNTLSQGVKNDWKPHDWRCDQMRKKVLSFFHEMGYATEGRLDMEKVNERIMKLGYLKKALNQYSYDELPKLVTQFEKIRNSHLKAVFK